MGISCVILNLINSSIILKDWKVGKTLFLEIISIERVVGLEQFSTLPYLIPYLPNGVRWAGMLFHFKLCENALRIYMEFDLCPGVCEGIESAASLMPRIL